MTPVQSTFELIAHEGGKTHLAATRVEHLDSIRGLAALFVLMGHTMGIFAWPATCMAATSYPFLNILFNGKEAVAMFFVLSGYVLSKPYVSQMPGGNRNIFLPTFYLRRFIRIWFPWFFAFVASIFVKEYFFTVPATTPATSSWFHWFWVAGPMTVLEFLKQCLFLEHDATRQMLNQDWSLGVELKGSILIPLFIWAARPGRLLFNFVAIAVLYIFFRNGHYYISFIIGVLVARFDHFFYRAWSPKKTWLRWALLFGGLLLYQTFEVSRQWLKPAWISADLGWIMCAVGCGAILLATFASPQWQHWLNARPLVFLGRISYSLYLLQFIILLAVLPHCLSLLNRLAVPMAACSVLTLLASVVLTVMAATLMYYGVEKPAMAFGSWSARKLQSALGNPKKDGLRQT